jgi:hypothetical protein
VSQLNGNTHDRTLRRTGLNAQTPRHTCLANSR